VRLRLPALPANVALVRQALSGLGDGLGLPADRLADIKIALTEACTNAVLHAYEEPGGLLDVTMAAERGRLLLVVRDQGSGMRPLPASDDGPPLGFGLALIASLADEFGILGGRAGTAVAIAFALGDADGVPPLTLQAAAHEPWAADRIALAVTPGRFTAGVLGRVVSLVAARADFSIDRLSDAQIVSDAIAGAAAAQALNGALRVFIDEHEHGFDLVVEPLAPGGGDRLVRDTELPGLGSLLERLTDGIEVEPLGDDREAGERVRIRLLARE